jgi:hypothetical protein
MNMKKMTKILALAMTLSLAAAGVAMATPSTTYWTPMVMDIQGFKVVHLGVDNYFTVEKTKTDSGAVNSLTTDVGLTVGVLPFEKIQMEIGIDGLYPSDFPYYFNSKIGAPEDALFKGAPALQIGIFGVGTESKVNQNVVYGVIGKTIPVLGRVTVGPYIGNAGVLKDSNGNVKNAGFMVAYDRGFMPVKDAAGNEYSKIVLAADYASGKNAIGGGGVGVYYYFTKDISFLTGPVWFNDKGINGAWKWTTQVDFNFPSF